MDLNRAAFLAASAAAVTAVIPQRGAASAPAETTPEPQQILAQLMDGNRRFVANQFPVSNKIAEKRALVQEGQAPPAAILGCADSRVIPELIFIQGIGQLFVTRVAGNYPDDVVIGSLEYAIEHLGTRLIMVLGHQGCGAVKAVYSAVETKEPLPTHLSYIQELIAPGIENVVHARGSAMEAVEANVHAAAAALRAAPPVIEKAVDSGHVRVVGAVYKLGSGEVRVLA
jgi:carbonic anhydrase